MSARIAIPIAFLMVAIALVPLADSSYADSEPVLSIGDVSGNAGDSVDVRVMVSDASMSSARVSLSFNGDALEVSSVKSSYGIVSDNIFDGGATIVWLSTDGDVTFDGKDMMVISLRISEAAAAGTYEINAQVDQTYASDSSAVSLTVDGGSVIVGDMQTQDDTIAAVGVAALSDGTVDVPIRVKSTLAALKVQVTYDSAVLEFVDVTSSPAVDALALSASAESGVVTIVWLSAEDVELSGDLFYLTFNVAKLDKSADVSLSLDVDEENTLTFDTTPVALSATGCVVKVLAGDVGVNPDNSVTVTEKDEVVSGDVTIDVTKDTTVGSDGFVQGTTTVYKSGDSEADVYTEAVVTEDSEGNRTAVITSSVSAPDTGVISNHVIQTIVNQKQAICDQFDDVPDMTIDIDAKTMDAVTLPSTSMDAIAGAGIVVALGNANVSLDKETIGALDTGDVKISVTEDVLNQINSNRVLGAVTLDIDLTVGGSNVHQLAGTVTASVGYAIPEGYAEGDVRAWYVSDSGEMEPIQCQYVLGKAVLTLNHLSTYTIGVEAGWEQDEPNTVSYVAIGIVVVLVISLLAYVAYRRH